MPDWLKILLTVFGFVLVLVGVGFVVRDSVQRASQPEKGSISVLGFKIEANQNISLIVIGLVVIVATWLVGAYGDGNSDPDSNPPVLSTTTVVVPVVPFVEGLLEEDAVSQLNALGIGVQFERVTSTAVDAGVVISQQPAEGTTSRVVELRIATVSTVPTPVVPSVHGLSEEDAVSQLNELGISVEFERVASDDAEAGLVVAQAPPEGSESAEVTLTISTGPASDVPVAPNDEFPLEPGSEGARVETIGEWLRTLGFDPGLIEDAVFDADLESAVRQWQETEALRATGSVDAVAFVLLRRAANPDFVLAEDVGCANENCEGEFIRARGDIAVYRVRDGIRRRVPDGPTMACLGGFDQVRAVSPSTLDSFELDLTNLTCDS